MIGCILAGGEGKRMESDITKCLHLIVNPQNLKKRTTMIPMKPMIPMIPMIIAIIMTCLEIKCEKIFIICGKNKIDIENTIIEYYENGFIPNLDIINFIFQKQALGTGDAIKEALPYLIDYKDVLILNADVPLLGKETLLCLTSNINSILIADKTNPMGYGRIFFDDNTNIVSIIEEKDCSEEEKKISYVNCGVYYFSVDILLKLIPQINNNNKQNEYYLTDLISLCYENNILTKYYFLPSENFYEILNVNTKQDLKQLNNYILTNL